MPPTTNMNLVLPDVSVTLGPTYASEVNQALTDVDEHDHSSGKGTPVPTAGMLIDGDLEFNSNSLTEVKSTKYDNQSATLSGPTDLSMTYVKNGELYYRDAVGNETKITNVGAVNAASASGIGGDYGGGNPALVSFTESTSTYEMLENTVGPAYANQHVAGQTIDSFLNLASTSVTTTPYDIAATDLVLRTNTSSAKQLNLPDPTLSKRLVIVKDVTGTSETNAITIHRFGSETIDGVAADKTLKHNFGIWYFLSDGTNWWVIKEDLQDKTSSTTFESSLTAGTEALPATFASPTLAAATVTEGTAVTRSTNTLTFPSGFTGKWKLEVYLLVASLGTGGGSTLGMVRLRNTTDSSTLAKCPPFNAVGQYYGSVEFSVTDTSKNYEVQFGTDRATAGSLGSNATVQSETSCRWRFRLTKLKDS